MKVPFSSSITKLAQSIKKDNTFFALQDAHNGLIAIKNTIESAGLNAELPTGIADGTNRVFRVQNVPSIVVVNGVVIQKTTYSYFNGMLTFNTAPAMSAIIESYYL